ncbi:AraC family transcriptional regulator [Mycetocola tolaasinivorans]|uniref:AraC family transcriptional regulator n=2 Tax=Mycetocola tolaasinivorans TaxID=76635 RepID=A0A3L7AC72_9MICO|nr:AraC family transcriptional regulator [Mycetocola tolaasinivorans]
MVDAPWLVTTMMVAADSPISWRAHHHYEHEILWSPTGNVTVEAADQVWLVPPVLGIWIPAGTPHRVRAKAGTRTYATYLNPDLVEITWPDVLGVSLSPALRELLLHNHFEEMPDTQRLRLQRTIVDLVTPVTAASLDIPLPTDPELVDIAQRIIARPDDSRTVEDWAATLNLSGRTLMRRFEADTGLSLTRWRILVRVRLALIDLAAGHTVAAVARRLGYANPSTFIDTFRSVTGHTPAAYFRSVSRTD